MSKCLADTWENQDSGCSFAVKSGNRTYCMHYNEGIGTCDCVEAQKIAYENYNLKETNDGT